MGSAAGTIVAATPGQINFQVPASIATGTVPVTVATNNISILSGTAQIAPTSPGIFVADPFNVARPGVALDQSGSLVTTAAGMWQITATVPQNNSGQTPIFVISGIAASNGVTLRVAPSN
jgi:hypothetical protein